MKKIAVIMIATVFGVIGTSSAHAQTPTGTSIPGTPELCAEADTRPPNVDCTESVPPQPPPYPPVVSVFIPTTTTTTDPGTTTTTVQKVSPPTTTVAPGVLPSTGSSGTSGFLQVGALLFTGGLIVVIAARRRSAVRPSPA